MKRGTLTGLKVETAVVGGGLGGCAAAIASAAAGQKTLLISDSAWLGGQLTAQAVPPDEHPWMERFGRTKRYAALRQGIRDIYRAHYPLTPSARRARHLNPGQGQVSGLCHEPAPAQAALQALMLPLVSNGTLTVLTCMRPGRMTVDGDRVRSLELVSHLDGNRTEVEADYFLDATETGSLIAHGGFEFFLGAESQRLTGEPHAAEGAFIGGQQAMTWCAVLGWDPGCRDDRYLIEPPPRYAFWRGYLPKLVPEWPGPLLSLTYSNPITLEPRQLPLFSNAAGDGITCFWNYRRILARSTFQKSFPAHELSVMNWPQNDYFLKPAVRDDGQACPKAAVAARELTLSLLAWLQREAPRARGRAGYRGLYPAASAAGTSDGLAAEPYLREGCRIQALRQVTEEDIGVEARGGQPPEPVSDSVGVGAYRIDLHPSSTGRNYVDIAAFPFQIPLSALVPVRAVNLLPACRNAGVTHVANGAFRLHPVEWNIGESAGLFSAFCQRKKKQPRQVAGSRKLTADFQQWLRQAGVPLEWPRPMRPL